MRVVVALGGTPPAGENEAVPSSTRVAAIRLACRAVARVAHLNELVVAPRAEPQRPAPHLLHQELRNELPPHARVATVLTTVEVDPIDPAFGHPASPVGRAYTAAEARHLADVTEWTFAARGAAYRRVVPAPLPKRILGLDAAEILLDHGFVVICAPGELPAVRSEEAVPAGRRLLEVEAAVDSELVTGLLAASLGADALVLAGGADGVYAAWGTPRQRVIRRTTPTALLGSGCATGGMAHVVRAACAFVEQTGGSAAIGSVGDAELLVRGEAGTTVTLDAQGLEVAHGA